MSNVLSLSMGNVWCQLQFGDVRVCFGYFSTLAVFSSQTSFLTIENCGPINVLHTCNGHGKYDSMCTPQHYMMMHE